MPKDRLSGTWCVIPLAIAGAFFTTSPLIAADRPFLRFKSPQELTPERMLSIARTLEQQGRLVQAKAIYTQLLAKQSHSEEARRNLDRIVAAMQTGSAAPAPETIAHQNPRRNSGRGNTAAVAAVQPRRIPSTPNRRDTNHLDEGAENSARTSGVPLAPREAFETATWHSSSAEMSERNRPTPIAGHEVWADSPPTSPSVVTSKPVLPRLKTGLVREMTTAKAASFVRAEPTSNSAGPRSTILAIADDNSAELEEELFPSTESSSADVKPKSLTHCHAGVVTLTARVDSEPRLHQLSEKSQPRLTGHALPTGRIRSPELQRFEGVQHQQLLVMLQADQAQLIPHLVEIATDESCPAKDRSLAAFLLGELGPEVVENLPRLRESMRMTRNSIVRMDLAQAVLLIQPGDVQAIQTLLERLRSTDETVQWYAAFALKKSASTRETIVVDALLDSLDSENDRLNRMVILTLGDFGPSAAKAVPALQAALQSPDPKTREIAAAALATIAPRDHDGQSSMRHAREN